MNAGAYSALNRMKVSSCDGFKMNLTPLGQAKSIIAFLSFRMIFLASKLAKPP